MRLSSLLTPLELTILQLDCLGHPDAARRDKKLCYPVQVTSVGSRAFQLPPNMYAGKTQPTPPFLLSVCLQQVPLCLSGTLPHCCLHSQGSPGRISSHLRSPENSDQGRGHEELPRRRPSPHQHAEHFHVSHRLLKSYWRTLRTPPWGPKGASH